MVRRKGELSSPQIDREWPYQVALPAASLRGGEYIEKQYFCRDLSLCPRTHFFWRDGQGCCPVLLSVQGGLFA